MDSQQILANSVNEVIQQNPNSVDSLDGFIGKVADEFLKRKLDEFPTMCGVMWYENKKKRDILAETAKRGRFDATNNTETYWSDSGEYLIAEDVPKELYIFMQVFVYKHFWSDDKVCKPFIRAICNRAGPMTNYEAMNLLIKVKQIYGPNSDRSLT